MSSDAAITHSATIASRTADTVLSNEIIHGFHASLVHAYIIIHAILLQCTSFSVRVGI